MAPQQFSLQLGIKRHIGQDKPPEPVYFKVDGGRFNSEKTLKLNTESSYELTFTIKPAHAIQSFTIEGGTTTVEEKEKDETKAVYMASWSTAGLQQNKRGNRKQVPIIIELSDVGSMTVTLQTKLYPEKETQHSHWGTCVSYIDYECQQLDSSSFIDILKETYR